MSRHDAEVRTKIKARLRDRPKQLLLISEARIGADGKNIRANWKVIVAEEIEAIVRSASKGVGKARLGWLAGIIDGEGWITALTNPGWHVRLGVANTDERIIMAVMDISHAICGSQGNLRVEIRENSKWKNRFDWLVSSRNALIVLKVIEPFLIAKREQAQLAILLQERITFSKAKPLSEDEHGNRAVLLDGLHRLNKRGE